MFEGGGIVFLRLCFFGLCLEALPLVPFGGLRFVFLATLPYAWFLSLLFAFLATTLLRRRFSSA